MLNKPLGTDRRTFVAGLTAMLGTTLLPRSVRAGGTDPILLVGGSAIAGALGLYLEQRLEKGGFDVHRKAKSSSGLARPDFYDWPKQGSTLYRTVKPGAAIVLFGGNDGQGLFMGKNASNPWIRWGEPGWVDEYSRRVRALADAVAPGGEPLFWLGMPVVRPPKLRARVERMNEIYRDAMSKRANRHFVDLWRVLANRDGTYTKFLQVGKKRVQVRADDGVHLSRAGANVVVDHVAPLVSDRLQGKVG